MKPRRWVLVCAAILLIVGGAFTWGMRLLERRLNLEQVVVAQIEPLVGGSFDVGQVGLGFFSAYLRDVSIVLPYNSFLIDVQDIKVGFSLRRLLTTKGDLGRSISTIILVRPRLTVNLSPLGDAMPLPDSAATQGIDFSTIALPLQELLVRKGSITVVGLGDEHQVFGEQLNGRIAEAESGLVFELYGRLASLRRNLALTGNVGSRDAPNRLSLRLDNARLTAPVSFPAFTITRGRADGVCEFSFGTPDSALPEARGWFKIRNGVASLAGVGPALTDLSMGLTLDGTVYHLDSLSGSFSGIQVNAAGEWDISRTRQSQITVNAEAIDIEQLLPHLPQPIADNLYGEGHLTARVRADTGSARPMVNLSGSGFSVLGMPLSELTGHVSIEPHHLRIDSLTLATMAARLSLSGTVALGESFPSYTTAYRCRIDSLPTFPWLQGRMHLSGTVSGRNDLSSLDVRLECDEPRIADIPLGDLTMTMGGNRTRLEIATGKSEYGITMQGTVESPFSSRPQVEGTVELQPRAVREFLSRVSPRADSIEGEYRISARIEGSLPRFNAEAVLAMDSRRVAGTATMHAAMQSGESRSVAWRLVSRGLRVGQEAFPLFATGRLYQDSMVVDSSRLLGGVTLTGNVGLTKPENVDINIDFDTVSLAAVNRWFFDGELPLDSGVIIGHSRLRGLRKNMISSSELSVRNLAIGMLSGLETDAILTTHGDTITALPLVLRKDGRVVVTLDTLQWGKKLRLKGAFDGIDIATFLGPAVVRDVRIHGAVSGTFTTTDSGLPVTVALHSKQVALEEFALDSITVRATMDSAGLVFDEITAREERRSQLRASGEAPWSFFSGDVGESDTMRLALRIAGDLLQSIEHNYCDVILGGSGEGTISASMIGTAQGWEFAALSAQIPTGVLTSKAYVPSGVEDFSFSMQLDDSGQVNTEIYGYIGRQAVSIRSSHAVPSGYRSFELGPLDFGIFMLHTPRNGIPIHLPGLHEPGEIVEVEFQSLPPFKDFVISGPVEELKLTGTWVLRNGEFTFPMFETDEVPIDFDPFPFINWEMDIAVGNRNVRYYWDLSGKKRRNLIRFVEAYLDPTSRIKLRGRDKDKSFQVLGMLRAYKGSVYFGKVFDRRFDVGLDFAPQPLHTGGYDNMPIMWGSAEAFSDTSRLERVRLTLQLTDPHSGGISERGRMAMIPRPKEKRRQMTPGVGDSIPNFVFHLSSDFDQIAGESEREFFREAGLRFTSFEGAGELVSSMGEEYLHRYLLQRFERRLARRLGLDVITFETSIASNYFKRFYSREFSEITDQWNLLALAHVGITIGRYFFRDNLFIKARGELVPIEELLVPEYSIGVEFQPMQYLFFDFNYGVHRGETSIEHDPRLNMQLRFPLTRLRKMWKF